MGKPSNLSWRLSAFSPGSVYLQGDTQRLRSYPFGTVTQLGKYGTYHAYARITLYEPVQFLADFTTQQEAMDFVNLMVGSIDYD